MPASQAQIDANRRNAQLSTGPTTEEGKNRSRANSLKHGLTGEGIVLPVEDVEEIDRLFETLAAEMKPGNELARRLVNRVALLTVRLERSAEHEAKAIAHKMRKATAEFDDARFAEMEKCYSWIAAEPETNARRLRMSPEGLNRILNVLRDLRDNLDHPDGFRWDWQYCEQLHHVLGLRRVDVPVSRFRALSDAMEGNFRSLNKADGADLEPNDRREWARVALLERIDAEIDRHQGLLDRFDLEGLALDRDEAAHRVLFDPSPAATLARKYEATSERGLFRTLKEFREVQISMPQVDLASEIAPEPAEEVGSFLPETQAEPIAEPDVDATEAEAQTEVVGVEPGPRKIVRLDKPGEMGRIGAGFLADPAMLE